MLGYKFEIENCNQLNDNSFSILRKAVPLHGVIHIKKQNFSLDKLIHFTKRFGEPVILPKGLRFNNIINEYPEITRVSNILPSGQILKNYTAAEYWHSDGNFWQPVKNYIFNLLYAEIIPSIGGETAFVDLRLAYNSLELDIKKRIEKLQIVVSCQNIPDFKNASPNEFQPDAFHRIKHIHIETGVIGLYFGNIFAKIKDTDETEAKDIMTYLIKSIENPEYQYIHKWDCGDLLIWDNTTVMHRSVGGYGDNPRLLYRTQAFISL